MRVLLLGVMVALLSLRLWGAGAHQEVSRTPPEIYRTELERLLTPAESVLKGRNAFPGDTTGGVVLLSESLHYRAPDGVLYRVVHTVYHASDESGVKSISSDVQSFDRDRESIFLVLAQAILPDGTRRPVDEKGVFIQTPQRHADSALYTSTSELNIVYPNVGTGVSTEMIVVIRENVPVIPGHFALVRTFASGWPIYVRRTVVDLPKDEWARMRFHTNMPGVPDERVEQSTAGRERRIWEKGPIPSSRWEERAPDLQFCAPTLRLTTLADWNEVANWFNGLVTGRSELGPELTAQVELWTKGVTERRKIIDILHEKVANDVRYTGLEFGLAGYQPYPCRDVWKNRYGDCKDKANLLRSMLAAKGIRAHVALLNTDSPARIERSSPSWLQFDHAITAVEDENGGYLFCDPTVKYLPAGTLPLSDLARELLVVRGAVGEWVKTPDLLDAAIQLSADLTVTSHGEMSGWFRIEATGSDAAYYASHYAEQDADDRLRSMQKFVEQFFPGANVLDTKFSAPEGSVRTTTVSAFFLRPADGGKDASLRFPFPADWLPELSTVGERRHPFGTSRREISMKTTLALPSGWRVGQMPSAFSAPSSAAKFSASWKQQDGNLVAELSWRPEKAEIQASDYGVYQRSVRAMVAWLEQPALLHKGDGTEPADEVAETPGSPVELPDFPVLASGEGQLRLVEERYPAGEKNTQRRAALRKTLQWFPGDPETVFTAEVQLLMLDRQELGEEGFADRVRKVVARQGAAVAPSLRAWAQYLEAQARWAARKDPKAIDVLKTMAANTELPVYRRTWAANMAAKYWAEKHPDKARDFLDPFVGMESNAQADNVALSLELHLRTKGAVGFHSRLKKLAEQLGPNADRLFAGALDELKDSWPGLPKEARLRGAEVLGEVIKSGEVYPLARPKVQRLIAQSRQNDAKRAVAASLRAYLTAKKPEWWSPEKLKAFSTADAIRSQIQARNDASDARGTIDASLQLWLHHDSDYHEAVKYLRWTIWWLAREKLDEDLLGLIAKESVGLPTATSNEVVECWTAYADHLASQGKYALAREWYGRVLACTDAEKHQLVEAHGEISRTYLREAKVDDALKQIRLLEPLHVSHRKGVDYLLEALVVHLERGEFDRGLELLARIREQDAQYINEAAYSVILNHLLRAGADPAHLLSYWKRAAGWRTNWNAILVRAGLGVPGAHELSVESNLTALIERLQKSLAARDEKAFLRNLDILARLAQWVPIFASDFANYTSQAAQLSRETWRSVTEVVLDVVGDLSPVDPQFDEAAKIWEAAALGDMGRTRECVAKAKALYERLGAGHLQGDAALRIWTMCAREPDDVKEALSEMRKALESGKTITHRENSLRLYSDALWRTNARGEHIALLERETARKDFARDSELGKILQTRLKMLREQTGAAAKLSADIAAWVARNDLAWVKHVAPASLDDPRFASLTGPLEYRPAGFTSSETLKYNLLLAQDERRTPRDREEAFRRVVLLRTSAIQDADQCASVTIGAMQLDALSQETRSKIGLVAATILIEYYQPDAAERVCQLLPNFGSNADSVASIRAAIQAQRIVRDAPEDWPAAAFNVLTEAPIDAVRNEALQRLFDRLGLLARDADAEKLLEQSSTLKTASYFDQPLSNVRLQVSRTYRVAKSLHPTVQALRTQVLSLPEAQRQPSDKATRGISSQYLATYTAQECFDWGIHRLRTLEMRSSRLPQYLRAFARPEIVAVSHRDLGPKIQAILLSIPSDDALRASSLRATTMLTDVDTPTSAAASLSQLQAFLRSPESRKVPQTRQTAAMMAALYNLRVSPESKPNEIFEALDDAGVAGTEQRWVKFNFHVARDQTAEAMSLLDGLDHNGLTRPSVMPAARALLKQLGRTAELKLLDEAIAERLARDVSETWLECEDFSMVKEVLGYAVEAQRGDMIPPEWVERVSSLIAEESGRAFINLAMAKLSGDTARLGRAADDLIRILPELYDVYLQRAIACRAAGKFAEEKEALAVFVKYCRDAYNHPEAVARLRELNGAGPAAEVITGH